MYRVNNPHLERMTESGHKLYTGDLEVKNWWMKEFQLLKPEEGESFWQPEPARGFVTVKVSPWTHPQITYAMGTQTIPPGAWVREHSHEIETEIILTLKGKGLAIVEGQQYEMLPGNLISVSKGIRHCFRNEGDSDLVFLWTITPPGLENFFKVIGRGKLPGDITPPSFVRPKDPMIDSSHRIRD